MFHERYGVSDDGYRYERNEILCVFYRDWENQPENSIISLQKNDEHRTSERKYKQMDGPMDDYAGMENKKKINNINICEASLPHDINSSLLSDSAVKYDNHPGTHLLNRIKLFRICFCELVNSYDWGNANSGSSIINIIG